MSQPSGDPPQREPPAGTAPILDYRGRADAELPNPHRRRTTVFQLGIAWVLALFYGTLIGLFVWTIARAGIHHVEGILCVLIPTIVCTWRCWAAIRVIVEYFQTRADARRAP